ncbi:MAG: hypothetical protein ACPL7G_06155 [Chloroflexia bacterium]
MSAKLRRWCDILLEVGWLLAVVLVTLYFDIYTKDSRIFEPQKALWLRIIVTMMMAVWAIRTLEENRERLQEAGWWKKALWGIVAAAAVLAVALLLVGAVTWRSGPIDGMLAWQETGEFQTVRDAAGREIGQKAVYELGVVESTPFPIAAAIGDAVLTFVVGCGAGLALVGAVYALRHSWREALKTAMVIPALVYVAVHFLATLTSVFPQASFYGGYVRQQGTLSVLAYIGLFFILAANLRRKEQLERLITVILVTSVPSVLYGLVQNLGIDPLPWLGNVQARVASTMGNAIFIAAYLIMILPLTGYRLLRAWQKVQESPPPEETPAEDAPILRRTYPWVLGAFGGFIFLLLLAYAPARISLAVGQLEQAWEQAMRSAQQAPGLVYHLNLGKYIWPLYGRNLLFTLIVTGITLMPAFLYAVPTLLDLLWEKNRPAGWSRFRRFWERCRPYAYLVVLAALLALGAALLLGLGEQLSPALGLEPLPQQARTALATFGDKVPDQAADTLALLGYRVPGSALKDVTHDARTDGFVWAGYLLGLLLTALLSRWQHARLPWGRDILWAEAGYTLLVGQSLFLFAIIGVWLPRATGDLVKWPWYLLALLIFLATSRIFLVSRAGGRLGYLIQVGGYGLLAALQVLCIILTRSRGPFTGLLAGVAVFVLLVLFLVAKNARGKAGEKRVSFWRLFRLSGGEVGQAVAFALLLVLDLLAVGALAVGGWMALAGRTFHLLGLTLVWWMPVALGAVALAATWLLLVRILFGPGWPRSAGPWIGAALAALVAVLGPFVAMVTRKRGRRWLWVSVLVPLSLVAIALAVFNLPDTPLLGSLVKESPGLSALVERYVQPLKDVPYLGRFGRLFEASAGTGKVRILIWFGDEIGTGAVGMIRQNWLRTLVGYGPESMHVAYNPYYPPELAHVEKRNASPDRSHNAIFDELVTMGVVGLAAYLFYFLAFFVLVWKLLWKAPEGYTQALTVALFSIGAAHFVETLTGIPIVSTRMYMWMAIGLAVALTWMPPFRREVEAAPVEVETTLPPTVSRRRRRMQQRRFRQTLPAGWAVVYAVILLAGLLLAYRANFRAIQADHLFWQSNQMGEVAKYLDNLAKKATGEEAQNYADQADEAKREAMRNLHGAIFLMPHEDFYFLSLAQLYLQGAQNSQDYIPVPPDKAGDPQAKAAFQCQAQDQFFASTELAITTARDLSPLNTDHYRNLAALHLAWFQQAQLAPCYQPRPEELAKALAYGEQALSLTPNNADLHNRLAQGYLVALNTLDSLAKGAQQEGANASAYREAYTAVRDTVLQKAQDWLETWEQHHLTSGGRAGDTHLEAVSEHRRQAAAFLQEDEIRRGLLTLAAAELQYSLFLDEKFSDTYQILGDVYRQLGLPAAAARIYEDGVKLKPDLLSDAQQEGRLRFLAEAKQLEPMVRAYQYVATQAERKLWQAGAGASTTTLNNLRRQAGTAYQTLGYIHILQGDYRKAALAYESGFLYQETLESHKNAALVYQQLGRFDLAREQAEAALELARQAQKDADVEALQKFLEQLPALQAQQIQANEQKVAADPSDYRAHYDLAGLYLQLERWDDALREARLAAEGVPADQQDQVALIHLRLGEAALHSGREEEARQAFARAFQAAPFNFEVCYGAARAYQSQGRGPEALFYARLALLGADDGERALARALVATLGSAGGSP